MAKCKTLSIQGIKEAGLARRGSCIGQQEARTQFLEAKTAQEEASPLQLTTYMQHQHAFLIRQIVHISRS